jgi:uncharacterized cupin superfamily protein
MGAGAGPPLHTHRADELIVVLEGSLDVRIGDETHRIGPDHTPVVPPDVPHGFTNVGPEPAKLLAFFPVSEPFDQTTFLEGEPPEAHRSSNFIGSGKSRKSGQDPVSERHDEALAEDFR